MVRALTFVLLATFPFAAHAGSIVGRLVDRDTGLPLPQCQVRLQSPARGAVSAASGWFSFTNLEPGLYWAEVTGSYHERRLVRLAVGDTLTIAMTRTGYPRFSNAHTFVDPTVPRPLAGSLRVRAIDEHARPIPGISVHLDPADFCLTDSTGWGRFASVPGGKHTIRIGSLLHENQQDSVLIQDGRSETKTYVMRVREPYRGRKEVTLNARGDLRIDDGSSATIHTRNGSTWIEDRFPFFDRR